MQSRNWLLSGIVLAAGIGIIRGQTPATQPPERLPNTPVRPADPPTVPRVVPPTTPPETFNAPSASDSGAPAPVLSTAPPMIGDFPGYYGCTTTTVQSTLTAIFPRTIIIRDPTGELPPQIIVTQESRRVGEVTEAFKFATLALSRGAFKIGENESPQPQDRFYVSYNNYHQVAVRPVSANGFLNPASGSSGQVPLRSTLQDTLSNSGGQPFTFSDVTVEPFDVHRETVGLEKTFFGGSASFGMRLPVFQSTQSAVNTVDSSRLAGFSSFSSSLDVTNFDPAFAGSRVGDLSMLLKYAFVNDPYTGRTLTGGMVLTVPTGGGIPLADGSRLFSTLIQPYVGGIQSYDRAYVHGFSSIAVPTDSRDITIWFNDIGVGYFLYRNPDARVVTVVAPTIEAHISTPLNDGGDGITASDVVFITGGVHVGLGRRAVVTFGVATPVTGPRPDQVEAAVQLNWQF